MANFANGGELRPRTGRARFVGEYASDVEVEWRTTRRRRVMCGGGTASVH
ncbi:hypothetical protein V6Z11_A06G207400 [Gossypium hirsutum]